MPTPTQGGQVSGPAGDFSSSMHTKSSPAQGTEDKEVVHRLSPPFANGPPAFHPCGMGITMGSPPCRDTRGRCTPFALHTTRMLRPRVWPGVSPLNRPALAHCPAPGMDGMSQRKKWAPESLRNWGKKDGSERRWSQILDHRSQGVSKPFQSQAIEIDLYCTKICLTSDTKPFFHREPSPQSVGAVPAHTVPPLPAACLPSPVGSV